MCALRRSSCFGFANGSLLIAVSIIIRCSQFYPQDKLCLPQLSVLQHPTPGLWAAFCFCPPAAPAAVSCHCPMSPGSKGARSGPCQLSALAVPLSVHSAGPGDSPALPQLVPAPAASPAPCWRGGNGGASQTGAGRHHRRKKESGVSRGCDPSG